MIRQVEVVEAAPYVPSMKTSVPLFIILKQLGTRPLSPLIFYFWKWGQLFLKYAVCFNPTVRHLE